MNENEQWDSKLFIFNLLISSIFIYNTNSTLLADTFKSLAVMSSITKRVKFTWTKCSEENQDSESEEEDAIKANGPVYLSVVRNFTLKTQYTPKEDINRFLKRESSDKDR